MGEELAHPDEERDGVRGPGQNVALQRGTATVTKTVAGGIVGAAGRAGDRQALAATAAVARGQVVLMLATITLHRAITVSRRKSQTGSSEPHIAGTSGAVCVPWCTALAGMQMDSMPSYRA